MEGGFSQIQSQLLKELLGTKIGEYNEIEPKILIDDEYESSNIAYQKELISTFLVISILITLHNIM